MRIDDERQLRAELDRLQRQARTLGQEDVRIGDGRRILLVAPDGSKWSLGVTAAGALTTSPVENTD